MTTNEDMRNDPEQALRDMRVALLNGELLAADDATDDVKKWVFDQNAQRAESREQCAARAAAKQAVGRYTLEEAAEAIEVAVSERREVMLAKLIAAVAAYKLAAFEPGRNARMEYGAGPGKSSRVRNYFEEAYWDDLNAWIDANEPRIQFRFPPPTAIAALNIGAKQATAGAVGRATAEVLLPLPTGDIAHSFDGLKWTETKWKKPLADVPKWLEACRVSPGKQGKSESLWNPVLVGAALVDRHKQSARSVRARFQTKPALIPWRELWKDYEAEYFSQD